MRILRLFKILVFFLILNTGCSNSANNEIEELKKKTTSLQREIDSLKKSQSVLDSITVDTPVKKPIQAKPQNTSTKPDGALRPGKHNFTLHWISWDEPGSVMIQPAEDGWHSIEGSQKSRKNDDFITINGKIKQVSPTELLFKGEIKSVVETNNGGKPCIKTGSKIFKTTKNRKYWRLQDMINCEGGMLTDYVDIYF